MVDVAMIRILNHDDLETFAAAADIPVINAMTARYHPCQLLADVQTFEELRGPIGGRRVAFIGDGYNMCNSYINAALQWGFELRLGLPARPRTALLRAGHWQRPLFRDARGSRRRGAPGGHGCLVLHRP